MFYRNNLKNNNDQAVKALVSRSPYLRSYIKIPIVNGLLTSAGYKTILTLSKNCELGKIVLNRKVEAEKVLKTELRFFVLCLNFKKES